MNGIRSRNNARISNDESTSETKWDEVKEGVEYNELLKTQPKEFIIIAEETCGLLDQTHWKSGWISSKWIIHFCILCDYFIKIFNEMFFKYLPALFQELKVKVISLKALFTKHLMGLINVMTPLDRHPPHEERHFCGSAHHKVLPRGTHRSMLRSGFWCNLDPKKQNLTSASTRNLLFVIFFVLSPETFLLVIPNKACALSQGRCSHKSWRGTWDIMLGMNLIRSPVLSISKHLSRLQKCLLFPRTFYQVRMGRREPSCNRISSLDTWKFFPLKEVLVCV